MNIREITPGIFYAGVNDRVKDKFEALWPLPYGVSYNSYVVKGEEKVALIDTVEVGTVLDFLKGLTQILKGRKIDYVVINHMEPDHSGSVPLILNRWPEAKLVGNKQTLAMVKGYYGVDDSRFMEISEGDSIDLGGKTLKFTLTPMVHWPETMMTYVPESKALFTGDAFGTFGALNGGVVDSEMDTLWYDSEMYRYYSNIVGKYGKFVQRAMQKLSDIEVEYICSTHGPVWHERIKEIFKIYDTLSKYESEEGVTIVYGSMYGNTAEVAEEIGRQLSARGVRTIKIHNASTSDLSYIISDAFRYKGLIVGSATYSMHLFPPIEQFMIAMETREVSNKVLGTFGSFTWASAAGPKLGEYAQAMKQEVAASLIMKHSMKEETLADIVKFAEDFMEAYKK